LTSDEVKDLRREASALKEVVAELTLENRLLKRLSKIRGYGPNPSQLWFANLKISNLESGPLKST
jgi:hypothetical protein